MAGTRLAYALGGAPLLAHLHKLQVRQEWTAQRREIGEYMVGQIQDNFDKQRLFDGSPMPQSKAAMERAGKTLIDSHHLYDSYVYQLKAGGVVLGSNKVYAAIHHFGGKTGRGHKTTIMARPVLGIGPKQERRIGEFMKDAIRSLL